MGGQESHQRTLGYNSRAQPSRWHSSTSELALPSNTASVFSLWRHKQTIMIRSGKAPQALDSRRQQGPGELAGVGGWGGHSGWLGNQSSVLGKLP